jgi:hypothetical protein
MIFMWITARKKTVIKSPKKAIARGRNAIITGSKSCE